MVQIKNEVQRLVERGIADKTRVTYDTGRAKFKEFCNEFGLSTGLPCSVDIICKFIAYMSLKNYAHSTINTYLAAVGFMHKKAGFADPTNGFVVGLMLDGVRREKGGSHDLRLPITFDRLKAIINALPSVCKSQFEALLFKAVFTCMFFGFLRIGEVAADAKNKVQESVLRRTDIGLHEENGKRVVVINFRVSKNNQFGRLQTVILSAQSDVTVCPVLSIENFLGLAGNSTWLFSHYDLSPLTKYQLTHVLKRTVQFCNFDNPHLYQSHSFRIGAATSAKERGAMDEEIQALGRWSSGAFRRYIRAPVIMQAE